MGPGDELGFPVLPHDKTLDTPRLHGKNIGHYGLEPGGINGGARSDHMLAGKPGEPPHRIGHNIHRIGGHHKNPVKPAFHNRRNNAPHHLKGRIQDIQAAPRILRVAAHCEDNHIHIAALLVVARIYFGSGMGEIHTM
ncbi:hypothetical protein D3C71_1865160 [compost metagenome]